MERKFNLGEKKGVIARGGFTDYSIYIAPDANDTVCYVAEELVRMVQEATGATLPVITEKKGKVISLDRRDLSQHLSRQRECHGR